MARGQAPPAATPLLSPQAAFEQATRPLDITRRAPENWSDVELDALKLATDEAKASCAARTVMQFKGEDLLAYAKLCALGQEWRPVLEAGALYLAAQQDAAPAEKLTGFPHLSTAFDYVVQASLHLKDPDYAVVTAQRMLRTVAYDDLVSEATGGTARYVQLIHNDEALALLEQRQPMLLALLRGGASATGSSDSALPLRAVYADAIALPAMQQFANQPTAAAASFGAIEAALPSDLSSDDTILLGETRRRYKMLGARLPALTLTAWLFDQEARMPPDPNTNFGTAAAFLLFPDWCNQCLAMNPGFSPLARRLGESGAHFYALMAAVAPPKPMAPAVAAAKDTGKGKAAAAGAAKAGAGHEKPGMPHVGIEINIRPTANAILVGTPTFVVPKETLTRFAAADFPMVVVVDYRGMVRAMQVAPENGLVTGGLVDQMVAWVQERWPRPEEDKVESR